jgi:hypothetical protein
MRQRAWIYFFSFSCMLGHILPVSALTIVRLGGEDQPLPELDTPFEFVQLAWNEVDEDRHGLSELVEIGPSFIEPLRLDPSVNLAPLLAERGGQVQALTWIGWGPANGRDVAMFDGDPATAFLGDGDWGGDYGVIQQKSMIFDFGGRFLLERIRFFPRDRFLTDRFVQRFIIGLSDGDPLKKGTREYSRGIRESFFDFDLVYDITENTDAVIDLELPAVPVRQLFFEAPENTQGIWEVAEMEIYGNGFAPFASYVSNVIDLGAAASLGQLTWGGSQDEEAKVDLSMRSGVDDDPNTYWRATFRGGERTRFDVNGRPLNLSSYNKLQRGERDGTSHDTENWAFWGAAYDFEAGQGTMVGDGPQRYVQIRADFASGQKAKSRLDYVQFAVSIPPVASEALAEIVPISVPPGQVTSFTYKIKPNLASEDLGFDSIGIDTPSRAGSVDAVRISGAPVAFEVMELEDEGFVIKIPRIDVQRTEELIEVDFQAEVFKFGTVFSGRVFDSERPLEVPQSITAGNADVLEDSDQLSVDLARFGERTIRSLALNPPVFSPNGDGINDVVQIDYDLLNLVGAVPVKAEVYDLSGRSLGVVLSDQMASGRFSAQWDGRDSSGKLLPPGLYLLRLSVEADKGEDARQAILSIVY